MSSEHIETSSRQALTGTGCETVDSMLFVDPATMPAAPLTLRWIADLG